MQNLPIGKRPAMGKRKKRQEALSEEEQIERLMLQRKTEREALLKLYAKLEMDVPATPDLPNSNRKSGNARNRE